MSKDLETSELNSVKNKNEDQKIGTELRPKKNYCYLCEVQCSGNKNFEEHQNGRKHLKKISISNKKSNKNNRQTKETTDFKSKDLKYNDKTVNQEFTTQSDKQKCDEPSGQPDKQNSEDSHSQISMDLQYYQNNKWCDNRQNSNARNFAGVGQNYYNRQYSNHPRFSNNPRYSNSEAELYPNLYRNQQVYYISRWNYEPPYRNTFINNNRFQSNRPVLIPNFCSPSQVGYNYTKGDASSSDYIDAERDTVDDYSKDGNKFSEKTPFKSYSTPPLLNDNSRLEKTTSSTTTSVTSTKQSPSSSIFKNDYSENKIDSSVLDSVNSCDSQKLSAQNSSSASKNKKEYVIKRVRSRSLNIENNNVCEKGIRDVNQKETLDSDNATKQQKIKDWTNNLLETHDGQISRLINPSNFKDKAAVSHLITNLSKSKRKETLTKLKLHPTIVRLDRNEDELNTSEEIPNITEPFVQRPDISTTHSEERSVQDVSNNTDVHVSVHSSSGMKRKKKSKSSDSEADSRNIKIRSKSVPNEKSEKSKSCKRGMNDFQQDFPTQTKKHKTLNTLSSKDKVQQSFHDTCFDEFYEKIQETNFDSIDIQNSTGTSENTKVTSIVDSSSDALPAPKKQRVDTSGGNQTESSVTSSVSVECQAPNNSSEFSIETLIGLFASGDVKVKSEFNDPVIEAIKAVDPNELIRACKSSSIIGNEAHKFSVDTSTKDFEIKSSDKEPCLSTKEPKGKRNCMSPIVLGSLVNDSSIPSPTSSNSSTLTESNATEVFSDSFENQCPSSASDLNKNTDNSLPKSENCVLSKDKSPSSPHLKDLIKELQEISSQEETVKGQLDQAKCKINEYNLLLEEWKLKKKKLHTSEEALRVKRNEIIKLMHSTVRGDENMNESTVTLKKVKSEDLKNFANLVNENISNEPNMQDKLSSDVQNTIKTEPTGDNPAVNSTDSDSSQSSDVPEELSKGKKKKKYMKETEIEIIPFVKKKQEIIVLDDSPEEKDTTTSTQNVGEKILTNIACTDESPAAFNMKNFSAHATVINNLVVFDDYMYTCSNDNTARRYSIKDPTNMVTYIHTAKNVTEIAVEKVQNDVLVCTSCSNRVISLFIASNGIKIKTYFQPCLITSVCKGWGNFYAGLANGSINAYNWRYEEKEIVKMDSGICRLATAQQGRLHVLIIVTSNGHICMRDAETGLVLRYVKGCIKLPSWLAVHSDLAYFSSSDKTLTILDIMSGRSEKKIYLSSHITGLAVYENNIFTISYSGVVNCYNKEKIRDKKLYYGAGKNSLTCIYVHKDWVFTGNRKGEVSVFQFDPSSNDQSCEFGNCCCRFGLREDLKFHIEKDHLEKKTLSKCSWGICNDYFPPDWNFEDKKTHVFNHLL